MIKKFREEVNLSELFICKTGNKNQPKNQKLVEKKILKDYLSENLSKIFELYILTWEEKFLSQPENIAGE